MIIFYKVLNYNLLKICSTSYEYKMYELRGKAE